MLSREDNELLTQVGPGTPMGELWRRFWIPGLLSSELSGPDCPPIRFRLLGEDLVGFRDTNGNVGVVVENCPHRGASLFFGRNEESGLRCVYHGWKFDVTGSCVDMPNEPPESNFKHKVRVMAYPAMEWGDAIWVYMGPPALRPPLPEFEWCRVPASHRSVGKYFSDASYAQGMEGDVDSAHVSFLHRWLNPADNPTQETRNGLIQDDGAPRLFVRETDYGFMYGARRLLADGTYYWRVTQWLLPCFSLVPNPNFPRGGRVYVPVDDKHTVVFSYWYHPERPLRDDDPKIFLPLMHAGTFQPIMTRENDFMIDREAQRTKTFSGIPFDGVSQDLAIVQSMGHIVNRTRERLGTADVAIIAARRILLRLAKQLRDGMEPFAASHGDLYHVRALDVIDSEEAFVPLVERNNDVMMARV